MKAILPSRLPPPPNCWGLGTRLRGTSRVATL
jgi:hypothetical protein